MPRLPISFVNKMQLCLQKNHEKSSITKPTPPTAPIAMPAISGVPKDDSEGEVDELSMDVDVGWCELEEGDTLLLLLLLILLLIMLVLTELLMLLITLLLAALLTTVGINDADDLSVDGLLVVGGIALLELS